MGLAVFHPTFICKFSKTWRLWDLEIHQKPNSLTTSHANCFMFPSSSFSCRHACSHSHASPTHSRLLNFFFPLALSSFQTLEKQKTSRTYWTYLGELNNHLNTFWYEMCHLSPILRNILDASSLRTNSSYIFHKDYICCRLEGVNRGKTRTSGILSTLEINLKHEEKKVLQLKFSLLESRTIHT